MTSTTSQPAMSGPTTSSTSTQHSFLLSQQQQQLLLAALNANTSSDIQPKKPSSASADTSDVPATSTSLDTSDKLLLDYDYDFDADNSFDLSFADQEQMVGGLPQHHGQPGSSSDGDAAESHEKRSHPDDEDDDEQGSGKRHEGDDKGSKKAGRKPSTNEPTTKRKAQNRAAQRAFRERKEKHLKDLETKVEDLQRASESANHENAMLRAKMEQMTTELQEYKSALSSTGSSANSSYLPISSTTTINNPNQVNFEFEFPQFGKLPSPPPPPSLNSASSRPPFDQHNSNGGGTSPLDQLMQLSPQFAAFDNQSLDNNLGIIHDFDNNMSTFGPIGNDSNDFGGLFSYTSAQETGKPDTTNNVSNLPSEGSRTSFSSNRGQSTSYNSPSDSDHSGSNNLQSSCATSITSGDSPLNKADKQLHTLGNSSAGANTQGPNHSKTGFTPGMELNGFDWSFLNNADGSFDPQLFDTYRAPQDAILAGHGLYDGSFFNEAIDMNQFGSPFNTVPSPAPAKKNLVAAIDERLNADDDMMPGENKMMSCNNIWEKIQSCPSVQSGEIDMDQLCSQLQQKAKCSGDGPVINEQDFKSVIRSMFPADKPCPGK